MANYLPIYILIGLIPLGFLIIALYSNYRSRKVSPTEIPASSSSNSFTARLRKYLTHRNGPATAGSTEDIEMQRIGKAPSMPKHTVAPPTPRHHHRHHQQQHAPRPLRRLSIATENHRAAALAALSLGPRTVSSTCSSNITMGSLPPRPSAPSPPSSDASASRFFGPVSWWSKATEDGSEEDAGKTVEIVAVPRGEASECSPDAAGGAG